MASSGAHRRRRRRRGRRWCRRRRRAPRRGRPRRKRACWRCEHRYLRKSHSTRRCARRGARVCGRQGAARWVDCVAVRCGFVVYLPENLGRTAVTLVVTLARVPLVDTRRRRGFVDGVRAMRSSPRGERARAPQRRARHPPGPPLGHHRSVPTRLSIVGTTQPAVGAHASRHLAPRAVPSRRLVRPRGGVPSRPAHARPPRLSARSNSARRSFVCSCSTRPSSGTSPRRRRARRTKPLRFCGRRCALGLRLRFEPGTPPISSRISSRKHARVW